MKYTFSNGDVAEGSAQEIKEILSERTTKEVARKEPTTIAKKLGRPKKTKKRGYRKVLGNRQWSDEEVSLVHRFLNDKSNYTAHKLGKNGLALKNNHVLALAQKLGRSRASVKARLNWLRRNTGIGY